MPPTILPYRVPDQLAAHLMGGDTDGGEAAFVAVASQDQSLTFYAIAGAIADLYPSDRSICQ